MPYLTNVARLDMGSGYATTLLPSAVSLDTLKERLQWLNDNSYLPPRGLGRMEELDGWTPLGKTHNSPPPPPDEVFS